MRCRPLSLGRWPRLLCALAVVAFVLASPRKVATQPESQFRPHFVQFYPQPLVFARSSAEVVVALQGNLSDGDILAGALPVELVEMTGAQPQVLDQATLSIDTDFWAAGVPFQANLQFDLQKRNGRLVGRLGATPRKQSQYQLALRFPDGAVFGASTVLMSNGWNVSPTPGPSNWVWNFWVVAKRVPQQDRDEVWWGFSVFLLGSGFYQGLIADLRPVAEVRGHPNTWGNWNAEGHTILSYRLNPLASLTIRREATSQIVIRHRCGIQRKD